MMIASHFSCVVPPTAIVINAEDLLALSLALNACADQVDCSTSDCYLVGDRFMLLDWNTKPRPAGVSGNDSSQ
jgi:hypothetical protein